MSKFFSLLILFSLIILGGVGCSANNKKQNNLNIQIDNNQGNQIENFASSTAPNNNRTAASLNDLVVGKQIMVMGAVNGNGSLTATEIVIGDFKNFASGTAPNMNKGSLPQPVGQIGETSERPMDREKPDGNFTPPTSPDRGESVRPGSRTGSGLGVASQPRFVGEILKKDDTSLVVKIANGGSQIVYFTEKTIVFLMEKPPQPAIDNPVNTSSPGNIEPSKQ